MKKNEGIIFILFIVLGLFIRLLFIPHTGFEADMAYWKGWGLAALDKGPIWLVNNTNYNYPPAFIYVLQAINFVYALIQSPYNTSYWANTNILYLLLVKAITIVADIGVTLLIAQFGAKCGKRRWGMLFAIVYLLSPVSIFDGSIWGQVDQFGLFFFLGAMYLLLLEKPFSASIVFTLSFLLKFQNIMFIPLFFVYMYKRYEIKGMARSLFVSLAVFVLITLPFIVGYEMDAVINLLIVNADWFPHMSLNAFNPWWLYSGLSGLDMSDKHLVFGITNAKQFGLYMFIILYAFATIIVFFSKKQDLLRRFILAQALVVFGFFHLLTESHERYLYHLMGLVPLVAFFQTQSRRILLTFVYYLLFILSFFLNMYIAFQFFYQSVWWPFDKSFSLLVSFFVSWANIVLFGAFVLIYSRKYIVRYALFLSVVIACVIGVIAVQNMPYIAKKPIALSTLKPIQQTQQYAKPVFDMTVNSHFGWKKWNRLSVNYFYYDKGIGSHANSAITYSVKGKFQTLKTDYGIDTEGGPEAEVLFIVEGDGKELFRSKPMGRFDMPKTAMLDIAGVDMLVLKIKTEKGKSINGAHADWLDPVLLR